ncbi:hypothetical protein TRFO_32380 [Tritrichomonas foetus]|uniref:Uncharacterized protein n=1 Tax=Tritrichomonas foetus TaxID=1144522 RepID=A0A1J4JUD1_9EUKA|nr:hypothetical protein TRFO_32380 [Tritrichomonas foetus]|eukprot:OHT00861.1 hypothetical protein TRFO_32380 [Tritrichomonas foetus]
MNQPNLQQNINQNQLNINQNQLNINQNQLNINQNHQSMNQNQQNMNQNGESEFPNHCFVNASQSNLPPHISNVFPQNAELLQASKSHGSGDSMISASTSNPAAIAARQALLSLRQVNSVNPPACPLPLPSSSSAGIGCSAGVANSKLPLLKPGNSSHIYGMGVPGNDPKITQRKSMPLINNIAMIHTGGVIHEERAGKAKRVEFNMNKRTNILLKTTAVPKS